MFRVVGVEWLNKAKELLFVTYSMDNWTYTWYIVDIYISLYGFFLVHYISLFFLFHILFFFFFSFFFFFFFFLYILLQNTMQMRNRTEHTEMKHNLEHGEGI